MKRFVLNSCAAFVTLLFISTYVCAAESGGPIHWLTDISEAAKATRSQNRPLVLFVTMKGCTYCTRMKQQTYSDAEVASHISSSYVAAQIDGRKNQRLARKIGVRVFPTTAIVSSEGKVLEVIHGFVDSKDLLQRLADAQQKHALIATVPSKESKK